MLAWRMVASAGTVQRTCKATPMKMAVAQWKEVLDAESGDVYYWNIETDAVQWEHPSLGKALV